MLPTPEQAAVALNVMRADAKTWASSDGVVRRSGAGRRRQAGTLWGYRNQLRTPATIRLAFVFGAALLQWEACGPSLGRFSSDQFTQ